MPLNYAKTAVLLVLLTGIFVAMGAVIGGETGMIIAFIVAMVMNVVSLWKSDTVVIRLFKGEEVDQRTAPGLYNLVADLARRADLPIPRVYVLPSPQPNAFATGRSPSNAAVAVSKGLIETLSKQELAGVIAHELAHIKNRDTITMSVAATIGGAISMVAQYLQFSMLFGVNRGGRSGPFGWIGTLIAILAAPFAAMLVQMAISRSREYQADRLGAQICGNPLWLATALKKINTKARKIVYDNAEAVPAAAHLFIVNPLNGRGVDSWFSTHPNVDNRISELKQMAREWGQNSDPTEPERTTRNDNNPQLTDKTSPPRGPWAQTDKARKRRGPWG